MALTSERAKILEFGFVALFAGVVLCVFYSVISMNGLVMGNDPAVHLEKAQIFLQTGNIPLGNLGWTPPLYEILLATFVSFTGAAGLEQMIFLVKVVAVLADLLLFFSVYLLGSKFFGRKVGAAAIVFLFMVFPMYEVNLWGGYTTVLGLAFMFLLFLYLPLSVKGFGHLAVTFLVAFSLVLSHQLALFVTVLVLLPVLLYMLVRSRGKYLKTVIALMLGGGAAFFLYYFQAVVPYLDVLVEHVLFSQRTMLYQVPATTFSSFMMNFGFIFFLGLAGLFVAFANLRIRRQPILFLILFLGFIVPLVLAESHMVGLLLPFQWFIYYLMPPLTILAAVSTVFAFNRLLEFYQKHKRSLRMNWLKVFAVILVGLAASTAAFRLATVYGKIMEGSVYYSTSDLKALDAGQWLRNTYPENATVVATDVPGFWFRLFSGKEVIAATNPIVQRNEISESVLELSYEFEHPLTLVRAYESKGGISDEDYISIDHVWNRISYAASDGAFVSYRENGVIVKTDLSEFRREILFDDTGSLKKLEIRYTSDAVDITKTIMMDNASYPVSVVWNLTPVRSNISHISLYVSVFFDLHFSFLQAYVPGVLNWENPWARPSNSQGSDWAVVNFSSSTLTGNQLIFNDSEEMVTYAFEFGELPDWGNVGALANMQIDALRFQYDFDAIDVNQSVSFSYRTLAFSKSSLLEVQESNDVGALFALTPHVAFVVETRDYHEYIKNENIRFIVYDRNKLDTKIIRSNMLELVYCNDRYVIFKIKDVAWQG